jgi:hypothetical protein
LRDATRRQLLEEVFDDLHLLYQACGCDHPELVGLEEIAESSPLMRSIGGAPFLVASSRAVGENI